MQNICVVDDDITNPRIAKEALDGHYKKSVSHELAGEFISGFCITLLSDVNVMAARILGECGGSA